MPARSPRTTMPFRCRWCRLTGQPTRIATRQGVQSTHDVCIACERRYRDERRVARESVRYDSSSRQPRRRSTWAIRSAYRPGGVVTAVPPPPRATATRLGSNRKFGVEVECNIPGGLGNTEATRIGRELNIQCGPGWLLKSDSSLGVYGVELNSPPLVGEEGFRKLQTALTILLAAGATVDQRCGLHVHHEVRDIGKAGLVRFVESWTANQTSFIDFLVSPSRRTTGACVYARKPTPSQLSILRSWVGSSSNVVGLDRRLSANACAYAKFGTVEVRQHQGTLSFRKIEAWVRLGQAMLDEVAVTARAVADCGSLRELLTRVHLDEDTVAYLVGRALHFGMPFTSVGVAAPVMS